MTAALVVAGIIVGGILWNVLLVWIVHNSSYYDKH